MGVIYEPKGRAREYSPLALNLYSGCDHGCKYCYMPNILYKDRESFKIVKMKEGIIDKLEKESKKYAYSNKQVLLSFSGDPYCKANEIYNITKYALKILYENRIPVSILTKGGTRALRDMDIFKMFDEHIQIGATMTFYDEKLSLQWEPGAAKPYDRIEMLKVLNDAGIKTWVSLEPVIDVNETLKLIKHLVPFVDIFKIGKINNFQGIDKKINWNDFLKDAINILRTNKKRFYVKKDLRDCAYKIKLNESEIIQDAFCSVPWAQMVVNY
jgi:DNA repair photolyase